MKNLMLIPSLLVLLSGCTGSVPPKEVAVVDNSKDLAIEDMKKLTTKDFKDPDSVQYRNLRYYRHVGKTRDGKYTLTVSHGLCGELNAKNSFGAYVGYREFQTLYGPADPRRPGSGHPPIVNIVDPDREKMLSEPWAKDLAKRFGPTTAELVARICQDKVSMLD